MSTLRLKPGTPARDTRKLLRRPTKDCLRPAAGNTSASKGNVAEAVEKAKLAGPESQPGRPSPPPLQPALAHLETSPSWREEKPLAIGFQKAAIAAAPEGLAGKPIRQAIGDRCRSRAYRRRLTRGGNRFAWDGSPAGQISIEDQRNAARSLRDRRKKKK